jgi:tripartite-type tricarboxylate transporter receptor subunit TctC
MKVTPRAIVTAAFALLPLAAAAQTWPTKPVRIIVPFAPGGTTDTVARLIARKYTDNLKQSFVVDNRAGAGGMIGADLVAKAPPDGYLILFTSASISVNSTLMASQFKLDPTRDLSAVLWAASVPLVLTLHPSVPAKTVKELIDLSKRSKNGLNGAHNGSGTTSQIALEMLRQQTGARVEPVAYKGGGPSTIALLSGESDLCFSTLATVKPHIEAGRLRGIAVTTRKPSSVFPKLPTMASMYPEFESDNWFGMFGPPGLSRDIVGKLNTIGADGLRSPEVREVIAKDGGDVVASTPEQLAQHLAAEIKRYAKVIRAGNIKPE